MNWIKLRCRNQYLTLGLIFISNKQQHLLNSNVKCLCASNNNVKSKLFDAFEIVMISSVAARLNQKVPW